MCFLCDVDTVDGSDIRVILTSWCGKFASIYSVSYMLDGCLEFLPSTVVLQNSGLIRVVRWDVSHPRSDTSKKSHEEIESEELRNFASPMETPPKNYPNLTIAAKKNNNHESSDVSFILKMRCDFPASDRHGPCYFFEKGILT